MLRTRKREVDEIAAIKHKTIGSKALELSNQHLAASVVDIKQLTLTPLHPQSHTILPCLARLNMISVLPSACLIFHAADCTQTKESLKQGQEERESERKTLG